MWRGSLQGHGEQPLVARAGAGHAPRQDLGAVGEGSAAGARPLVVDVGPTCSRQKGAHLAVAAAVVSQAWRLSRRGLFVGNRRRRHRGNGRRDGPSPPRRHRPWGRRPGGCRGNWTSLALTSVLKALLARPLLVVPGAGPAAGPPRRRGVPFWRVLAAELRRALRLPWFQTTSVRGKSVNSRRSPEAGSCP